MLKIIIILIGTAFHEEKSIKKSEAKPDLLFEEFYITQGLNSSF